MGSNERGYVGYTDHQGILRFRHDTSDHVEEMHEADEGALIRYTCPRGCDSFALPRGIWKLPDADAMRMRPR